MQTSGNDATRERFEAVRRYFTKTPTPPVYGTAVILAVCAALCTLPALVVILMGIGQRQWNSCFSCVSVLSAVAAIALAVPALLFYRRTKAKYDRDYALAEPKPSDAQIDTWHDRDCEFYEIYALKRLNLTREQVQTDNKGKPFVVVGSGPSAQVHRGTDGKLRFSSHEILVIYLTRYHLAAYKCVVDLHDGLTKTEVTHEYHYSDVVSVSTQRNQSKVTLYVEGQPQDVMVNECFTLSISNGEQISVATDFDESLKLLQGTTNFARTSPESAVTSIRTRLRQFKGGTSDTGPLS